MSHTFNFFLVRLKNILRQNQIIEPQTEILLDLARMQLAQNSIGNSNEVKELKNATLL